MGQIATGYGNAGDNPSGTGAYIFGETIDPLEAHYANLNSFDAAQQQRKAEQKAKLANGYKLVADLDADVKGIMDTDAQYFREQAQGLQQYKVKMFAAGLDPDNPAFGDAYTKGQYGKAALQTDIEASKAQKEILLKAFQEMAQRPDKYDIDKSNTNIAMFRATPFATRKNFDMAKLLVPKKVDLLTITKDKVLKDAPMDISTTTQKDQFGRIGDVSTKTYNPEHIKGLAYTAYNSGGEVTEAINTAYDGLDPNMKAAFQSQAQAMSTPNKTVSPAQLYFQDYLQKLNTVQNEKKDFNWSPMDTAYAGYHYRKKEEEEGFEYVAETMAKSLSEDTGFWGTPQDNTIDMVGNLTGGQVSNPQNIGTAPRFSTALSGTVIGVAPVPKYARNEDGTVKMTKDAAGRDVPQIETYSEIPNRILQWKRENGKTYLQTDESLENLRVGTPGATGWTEVNDRTIDQFAPNDKARTLLRSVLVKKDAYPNQNVQLNTSAKPKEKINW